MHVQELGEFGVLRSMAPPCPHSLGEMEGGAREGGEGGEGGREGGRKGGRGEAGREKCLC